MISRSEDVTDFCVDTIQNRETKFLLDGPPPLQSSTKSKLIEERQWSSQSNKGRSWGLNTVLRFKGQRDADSIWSKWNWPIYSLQMEPKGRFKTFPVYGRPRIIDILLWHGNPTLIFIGWHFMWWKHGYTFFVR